MMHMSATTTCWPIDRSTPKHLCKKEHGHTLVEGGTVLVGTRADGENKAADFSGQPQVLLGTRIDTGSVALLDDVLKAVIIASCVCLKNWSGDFPATNLRSSE
jgi:hypothetical protein